MLASIIYSHLIWQWKLSACSWSIKKWAWPGAEPARLLASCGFVVCSVYISRCGQRTCESPAEARIGQRLPPASGGLRETTTAERVPPLRLPVVRTTHNTFFEGFSTPLWAITPPLFILIVIHLYFINFWCSIQIYIFVFFFWSIYSNSYFFSFCTPFYH